MDDAAALDAAVHMLDADTPAGNAPIGGFLRACEGAPPRLLRRHDHFDLRERKRQKAEILEQPAACWQGIRGAICNLLIVGAADISRTEKENRECRVDQQDVFDRVTLFLAAIIPRLLSWLLGTADAPFSAIVPDRGEAGAWGDAGVGGSDGLGGSCPGTTSAYASTLFTPRLFASSATDRVGASPSVHSVACNTPKRT